MMKNFGKLISKHLFLYFFTILIIFVIDITIFFFSFYGSVKELRNTSPTQMLQNVTIHLNKTYNNYSLENDFAQTLSEQNIWAMLINSNGAVIWSENLPDMVSLQYSLKDVAGFSKGYLNGYPVFTTDTDNNLLVLGYPKDSYSKIESNYLPISAIKKAPIISFLILVSDLIMLYIVYHFSKRNILSKTSPIIDGIQKLSDGETVSLCITGELAEIGESVNRASILLKKQDQARANWISGISHDIRTPLSTIIGYADTLSNADYLDDNSRMQAVIIKEQSIQIKNLVQDLNLVSQLDYNRKPLKKDNIYLCKLIREVLTEFLNTCSDHRYDFNIELSPEAEPLTICGDSRLLTRALQNIISNSINHNPSGCTVTISLSVYAKTLLLVIRDNGNGITPDKLKSLNTIPHYLESTDDRLDLRHGLGLMLVKEIILLHNGSTEINSQLDQGFETIIHLPYNQK